MNIEIRELINPTRLAKQFKPHFVVEKHHIDACYTVKTKFQ